VGLSPPRGGGGLKHEGARVSYTSAECSRQSRIDSRNGIPWATAPRDRLAHTWQNAGGTNRGPISASVCTTLGLDRTGRRLPGSSVFCLRRHHVDYRRDHLVQQPLAEVIGPAPATVAIFKTAKTAKESYAAQT